MLDAIEVAIAAHRRTVTRIAHKESAVRPNPLRS
jgi:hypothetical protein